MHRSLVATLLLLALPAGAQQRVVRGMVADADIAIRLWVPAGFVEVQGWDHDSVDVRVTPAAGTALVGGGTRAAAKFSLETSLGDAVLASATMRVKVPRGARVWVKSTTATVVVQGVRGELDVLQVSGPTTVRSGQGVVRVESIAGDVSLNAISGATVVRGGAGRVGLSMVAGTLDVSTVSGMVSLTASPEPLQGTLETVGGEVQLFSLLHAQTRLGLATHDGPISIISTGEVPRVEGKLPGAGIPPSFRNATGSGGVVSVRTFKGTFNIGVPSGI